MRRQPSIPVRRFVRWACGGRPRAFRGGCRANVRYTGDGVVVRTPASAQPKCQVLCGALSRIREITGTIRSHERTHVFLGAGDMSSSAFGFGTLSNHPATPSAPPSPTAHRTVTTAACVPAETRETTQPSSSRGRFRGGEWKKQRAEGAGSLFGHGEGSFRYRWRAKLRVQVVLIEWKQKKVYPLYEWSGVNHKQLSSGTSHIATFLPLLYRRGRKSASPVKH